MINLIMLTHNITLIMDDATLTQLYEARFLGTVIDSQLTWQSRLNDIKRKIYRLIGVIYNIRDFLMVIL